MSSYGNSRSDKLQTTAFFFSVHHMYVFMRTVGVSDFECCFRRVQSLHFIVTVTRTVDCSVKLCFDWIFADRDSEMHTFIFVREELQHTAHRNQQKGVSTDFKRITLDIDCVVNGSPVIWVITPFLSAHSSNKHNQAASRSFPLTLLGATAVWDSTWCKNKPNVSTAAQAPLL